MRLFFRLSNIVIYVDDSMNNPTTSQGFTSSTTGVFTVSDWNLTNTIGYVIKRDDTRMKYGYSRRNVQAYSQGMAGTVRMFAWWSPATPEELADEDRIIIYGNDSR